jgi:serine/threonine protein kinase
LEIDRVLEKIGEGVYGEVAKVEHLKTKTIYALKKFYKTNDESVLRELAVGFFICSKLNFLRNGNT